MSNQKRRVYISEELYKKIMKFAQRKWATEQTRTAEGKPLFRSFHSSIEEFIKGADEE